MYSMWKICENYTWTIRISSIKGSLSLNKLSDSSFGGPIIFNKFILKFFILVTSFLQLYSSVPV